jgi:uncharacterized protein YndB with AHSA1/START domain
MTTRMTTHRRPVVSLPTDEQILVTREFDAPRRLVYRALTEPDLVKRWWTAGHAEATSVEVDLRVGGGWRYLMTLPDGTEIAFHGQYREIIPDRRLVYSEVAEQKPGLRAIKSVTLTDTVGTSGSGTTFTLLSEHGSRRDRDAYLAMMGDGLPDATDLLEQVCLELLAMEGTDAT